tara:strand:+ start:308 stop:553 length:246 start_codon:yes stop_codon:yes gene_type:complete
MGTSEETVLTFLLLGSFVIEDQHELSRDGHLSNHLQENLHFMCMGEQGAEEIMVSDHQINSSSARVTLSFRHAEWLLATLQ